MGNFKKYKINGKEYDRVSNVLAMYPKPWMPNYIKKYARENFIKLLGSEVLNYSAPKGPQDDAQQIISLIDEAKVKHCLDAHVRHTQKAIEMGNEIHRITHEKDTLGKTECPTLYQPILETYLRALRENDIKIIESERVVKYEGVITIDGQDIPFEWAGTLDRVVIMRGQYTLIDLKSFDSDLYVNGKPKKPRIKPDHEPQAEAYRRARNEEYMENSEPWRIKKKAILYLDRRDMSNYYLHEVPESQNDKDWSKFKSAYLMFRSLK